MAKRVYRKPVGKGSVAVSAKLPKKLFSAIERHARALKVTRSNYIHLACAAFVKTDG